MFSAFMEQYKPTPSAATALQSKEVKKTDQAGSSHINVHSAVQELASSDELSISSSGMYRL